LFLSSLILFPQMMRFKHKKRKEKKDCNRGFFYKKRFQKAKKVIKNQFVVILKKMVKIEYVWVLKR